MIITASSPKEELKCCRYNGTGHPANWSGCPDYQQYLKRMAAINSRGMPSGGRQQQQQGKEGEMRRSQSAAKQQQPHRAWNNGQQKQQRGAWNNGQQQQEQVRGTWNYRQQKQFSQHQQQNQQQQFPIGMEQLGALLAAEVKKQFAEQWELRRTEMEDYVLNSVSSNFGNIQEVENA